MRAWASGTSARIRTTPNTCEHLVNQLCCDGLFGGAIHVDVANTVVINYPVADVSQYAADPDNAPLWYENIKSVEWTTPRPVQVGSQIDFVAQLLGRRLAYTYEVVEFVPGRHLRMRTQGPPFAMETTYT